MLARGTDGQILSPAERALLRSEDGLLRVRGRDVGGSPPLELGGGRPTTHDQDHEPEDHRNPDRDSQGHPPSEPCEGSRRNEDADSGEWGSFGCAQPVLYDEDGSLISGDGIDVSD